MLYATGGFMDVGAILERVRSAGLEPTDVEVKSAVGGLPRSVPESLSAFADGQGGHLILGVSEEDNFQPAQGFRPGPIREALAAACADKLAPPLRPDIHVVGLEGGTVVAARIDPLPATDKPCYVKSRGRYGGSYIRTGDGDRRLSDYEVGRLLEEHNQPRWDEEVVPDATIDDLDSELVGGLLQRRPRVLANTDDLGALQRLYVLRKGPDGGLHPTLGGLLAMGTYPQEFFPRLTVTFAAYPGVDKSDTSGDRIRMLDRETLAGPIPVLVRDAVAAVERNMRSGALIEGAFRRDVPDYPPVAVREAVTNALMHRDYSPRARGTQVQVNMYVDRLEILNPGGLYGTVTVHDLGKAGISSARNQRLSALLEDVELPDGGMVAENRGTGYATIQSQLRDAMMPPPVPRDSISMFTLTFPRRSLTTVERSASWHSDLRLAILNEVSSRGSVSAKELMDASGLSRTAVLRQIHGLINDGTLTPTEPRRSPKQRYRMR